MECDASIYQQLKPARSPYIVNSPIRKRKALSYTGSDDTRRREVHYATTGCWCVRSCG